MTDFMPAPAPLKLSICIATFNRGAHIGETLDSILGQMTDNCEIVVVDGGSTDDTERLMSGYSRRFERVRYVRKETNGGFDRDCDSAVELASGEYCWLMSDDDLVKPGAVTAVLEALCQDFSLVILNAEFSDFSMSKVLHRRWLDFETDRTYDPENLDRLFLDLGTRIGYVGGIVIKRTIWLARERTQYYGSWFVFLGVIFQSRLPGKAVVIAEPLISYRMDNTHTFSRESREIMFLKWPALLDSLPISELARRKAPWRSPKWLLILRGLGLYSHTEYRRWIRPQQRSIRARLTPALIAQLPGVLVNAFFCLCFSPRQDRFLILRSMHESPLHVRNWRIFKHKESA